MTIKLVTGLPGACKTLYTLSFVKAWAEKEGRPVYYAGIKDLMLPWTEIEATRWMDCPSGSIIVIDECQTVFRPRSFGSNVPDYVAKLETHRHQGLDIVLITQHPMLCDPSVRRLAGSHIHIVRKWGMQKSTLHEWNSVRENCDKPSGRVDSIKHHWSFDKAAFKFYKSAEVHTVKRNIPLRVWLLFVVMPLILGFLVWKFYGSIQARMNPAPQQVSQSTAKPATNGMTPMADRSVEPYMNPMEDAKKYVFEQTPRVAGLQMTAPRYDKVTEPTKAPIPSSCVASKDRCKCYTQQATILDTPDALCRQIVERGFFVDFDDGQGRQQPQQASDRFNDAYLVRADSIPVVPTRSADASTSASSTTNESAGYGVLGARRDEIRRPAL